MSNSQVLGYPRMGRNRELKKAIEKFWKKEISENDLQNIARALRKQNWQAMRSANIDWIPSNDFSFYDMMLDTAVMVDAVPERYRKISESRLLGTPLQLYFAMARGFQNNGIDVIAMEMTKWFDTNYHYIVSEFHQEQEFKLKGMKIFEEYVEAKDLGVETKPVLIGPLTFLLLGKAKDDFDRLSLLDNLLPVYVEALEKLESLGVKVVQIDEPCLVTDLDKSVLKLYQSAYKTLKASAPNMQLMLATYFGPLGDNLKTVLSLDVDVIHIDCTRNEGELDTVLKNFPADKKLSLGLVDGRNIWLNNFSSSIESIEKALKKIDDDSLIISSSSSLLHTPYSVTDESSLDKEIKSWMAFAEEKLREIKILTQYVREGKEAIQYELEYNKEVIEKRKRSPKLVRKSVQDRVKSVTEKDYERHSPFKTRKEIQEAKYHLPLYPTTTIGSFPQTKDVRNLRLRYKKKEITQEEYDSQIKQLVEDAIRWQEHIGMDVLVHGEFERNDMVEYFGEQIEGFTFTKNGWVQSYGTRCVKPPVIYGDAERPYPMTVEWSQYAQSLTQKPVKGMLTGPVTILQWSFVRDDQPRSETCKQIALALRDEVTDLEKAGVTIIQIDEPALREGLPIRKRAWKNYLDWAIKCFRLASSGVQDDTQIHTHMCYSEFNDIMDSIAQLDADVISIESSRSQMEILNSFKDFKYPNDIGPGVYDIHSERVPSKEEIKDLLLKAKNYLDKSQLWVNPDCGLKTRQWEETRKSLQNMIAAAKELRQETT